MSRAKVAADSVALSFPPNKPLGGNIIRLLVMLMDVLLLVLPELSASNRRRSCGCICDVRNHVILPAADRFVVALLAVH